MPLLADRFRLMAPDLPGFGQSEMPAGSRFPYTFENLIQRMERFTGAFNLERFARHILNYGAPVGPKMVLKHPERIAAIISQNDNACDEGQSTDWDLMKDCWIHSAAEYRKSQQVAFTLEATCGRYVQSVVDTALVSPDGGGLDDFYLGRPGAHGAPPNPLTDYGGDVALHPTFQRYFRPYQSPPLAAWGKHDPYFVYAGAEAFRRVCPATTCVCSTLGILLWRPIVEGSPKLLGNSSAPWPRGTWAATDVEFGVRGRREEK